MIWLTTLFACSGPSELRDCADATLAHGVWINAPNEFAPLSHRLTVDVEEPVAVAVSWTDGAHSGGIAYDVADVHEHTLVGWRPGRTYEVEVTLTPPEGRERVERCAVQTAPLPAHFPLAEVSAHDAARSMAGDTLVSMRMGPGGTPAQRSAIHPAIELAVVYDAEGEVLWWMAVDALVQDVREVEGGLLIMAGAGPGNAWVGRYGWDGQLQQRWAIGQAPQAVPMRTTWGGSIHHDATVDEAGRMWALGRGLVSAENLPDSYEDLEELNTRAVDISYDYVFTFDEAGTVLDETAIADLVPLERLGCDSLSAVRPEGWRDWAHANALVLDGDDVVLSLRNQDAVIAYDRESKDVSWVLGHPGNWPPELEAKRLVATDPTMPWFWHAHAPMFGPDLEDGRRQLVLFDNGSYGAAPPEVTCGDADEPGVSRVVGYRLDPEALEVEEAFSFEQVAGGQFWCRAVGDADWLESGTILSTWGWLESLPNGQPNSAAGVGGTSVRLVEFDPDDLSEVWHLYLWSPSTGNPFGWTAYRADRIPSLTGRIQD